MPSCGHPSTLTATVEPFFPTPPVNMMVIVWYIDHDVHMNVDIGIKYHKLNESLKNYVEKKNTFTNV